MAEAIEDTPFAGSIETSGQFLVTHASVMGLEGADRNPENVAKSWQRASPFPILALIGGDSGGSLPIAVIPIKSPGHVPTPATMALGVRDRQ